MDKAGYSRFHKEKTGQSLKSEQMNVRADEFKGRSKAQLLAEATAHDKKRSLAKKIRAPKGN